MKNSIVHMAALQALPGDVGAYAVARHSQKCEMARIPSEGFLFSFFGSLAGLTAHDKLTASEPNERRPRHTENSARLKDHSCRRPGETTSRFSMDLHENFTRILIDGELLLQASIIPVVQFHMSPAPIPISRVLHHLRLWTV